MITQAAVTRLPGASARTGHRRQTTAAFRAAASYCPPDPAPETVRNGGGPLSNEVTVVRVRTHAIGFAVADGMPFTPDAASRIEDEAPCLLVTKQRRSCCGQKLLVTRPSFAVSCLQASSRCLRRSSGRQAASVASTRPSLCPAPAAGAPVLSAPPTQRRPCRPGRPATPPSPRPRYPPACALSDPRSACNECLECTFVTAACGISDDLAQRHPLTAAAHTQRWKYSIPRLVDRHTAAQ